MFLILKMELILQELRLKLGFSPSWFGDMCLVQYQAYQLGTTLMRGNFDLIQSFTGENDADGSIFQAFPYSAYQVALQNRMGAIQTGVGKFSGSIEEFNADGFGEKDMYITHNPCVDFN